MYTSYNHVFHNGWIINWFRAEAEQFNESTLTYFDVQSPNGWQLWGPAPGPELPGSFLFHVRAPDGRLAIGRLSGFTFDDEILWILADTLAVITRIPRVHIRLPETDFQARVLGSVTGTEDEAWRFFDLEGSIGPLLWQDNDFRTDMVLDLLADAPIFSLFWPAQYQW